MTAIKTVGDIRTHICKDFDPIVRVDNKMVCSHREEDHCNLPTHFVCELYSYKLRMMEHTSISQMGTFLRCPQLYRLRYVLRVPAPTKAPALWLGSQFHEARAKIDERLPYAIPVPPPDCRVTPEQRIILLETIAFYKEHHSKLPHPQKSEVFKSGFLPDGTAIQAWFDGYSIPGEIFEYKYTAVPDTYNAKKLRRQLSTYFYLEPNAVKVVVFLGKKLALRMSKADNNDLGQFAARVRAELVKLGPAKVFQVKEYSRAEFPIDDEMQSSVMLIQLIKHAVDFDKFPCNYDQCDGCEFEDGACK